jgi:alcohol dehydrogenase class IV
VFCLQFEAMAGLCKWTSSIKATHLLAALQGQALDIPHGVPKEVTYEETVEALEDCFGYQRMATAYHSQLKTRTQHIGKSLL